MEEGLLKIAIIEAMAEGKAAPRPAGPRPPLPRRNIFFENPVH